MVESGNAPEITLSDIEEGVRITVKNARGEEDYVDVPYGTDGKSAYEYAKEGGFTGTEEDFSNKIAREIPSKVSELENDKSFITAQDAPVQSVNNKTGAVNLNADDVGARPNTWTPTYSEVGAEKSGTADTAVSEHNVKTDAHNDIRILLQGLSERLNAIANSTDVDLDDFKEVVAYIKSNRSLIDEITSKKINYTDIIDNLTTNVTDKPLSAAQGVALKGLIDTLAENKLDESALDDAISTALAQANERGEFDGKDGKSAYEYAKDGGYTGTEAEFAKKLAAEWQLKTDESLDTKSKEVVGAINELRGNIYRSEMVGTWVFNDTPVLPSESFAIKFTDGLGTEYGSIDYSEVEVMFYYSYELGNFDVDAYFGVDGEWAYEEAKIINILEEPSTEAADWIKANAVKQVVEYQPKTDEALETTDKTVVGAINELNAKTIDKIQYIDTYLTSKNENVTKTAAGITWVTQGAVDGNNQIQMSQRVPIVAGDNVTFAVDEENQVVKINAEGGGSVGGSNNITFDNGYGIKGYYEDEEIWLIRQSALETVMINQGGYDVYIYGDETGIEGELAVRGDCHMRGDIGCQKNIYIDGNARVKGNLTDGTNSVTIAQIANAISKWSSITNAEEATF